MGHYHEIEHCMSRLTLTREYDREMRSGDATISGNLEEYTLDELFGGDLARSSILLLSEWIETWLSEGYCGSRGCDLLLPSQSLVTKLRTVFRPLLLPASEI